MNIEIIAGSPRANSISVRVALHLQQYLSQLHPAHAFNLLDVRDFKLGSLENVFSSVAATPDQFKPLAERMFAANAFIIVTPEYNGSYTSDVKNLFDHFPKQAKKAFGLVSTSTGAMGGMRSTQALLLLVPALFGIACPNMLVVPQMDKKFTENGSLVDANFEPQIQNFTQNFMWLANSLHSAQQ